MGELINVETCELMKQERVQTPVSIAGGFDLAAVIERVVMLPDAGIEKIERLLEMQAQYEKRLAEKQFNKALADMQNEMPIIAKNKEGYGYRYATYDSILRETRPVLAKFGFSVLFEMRANEQGLTIVGRLMHAAGHSVETSMTLPVSVVSKDMNQVQAVGSARTYGMRYVYCALLNISAEDDDDAASAPARLDDVIGNACRELAAAETDEALNGMWTGYKKMFSSDKKAMASLTEAGRIARARLNSVQEVKNEDIQF